MKYSRFGDVGYWYEAYDVPHEQNQAMCAAKGGNKVMFRLEGSPPHIRQWISTNCKNIPY